MNLQTETGLLEVQSPLEISRPSLKWLGLWISAGLISLIAFAFWPVVHNGFIRLDDNQYILENSHVVSGLAKENFLWAFQAGYASNWHPLTWLSHMLDVQLFGLKPLGHHMTNLILHTANTLLLFWLLVKITERKTSNLNLQTSAQLQSPGTKEAEVPEQQGASRFWPCATVAALFGVHPLHVESVAWVAERKDMLSAFFFLLTLWTYAKYVQSLKSKVSSLTSGQQISNFRFQISDFFYWLSLLLFALGLMSKPMLVTTPFVLLLLDFWPLDRVYGGKTHAGSSKSRLATLLFEKVPFFALAAGSSAITFYAQKKGHAVTSVESLTIEPRVANTLLSYIKYLSKTLWPKDLAIFYPHPAAENALDITAGPVLLAGLFLLAITFIVIWRAKSAPWLVTGWFWYLGTLVPVIGLVQVGGQGLADRYTYLPLIGIFICAAWAMQSPAAKGLVPRLTVLSFILILTFACASATRKQVGYWRTDKTLFEHALAATGRNALASYMLGLDAGDHGDMERARSFFKAALEADPAYADAHYSMAFLAAQHGNMDDAIQEYQAALRQKPWHAISHNGLGAVYWKLQKKEDARAEYESALRAKPDFPEAHYNLGVLLASEGDLVEASAHFKDAARLKPDDLTFQARLAENLVREKKYPDAELVAREVLRRSPTNKEVRLRLGELQEKMGKKDEAVLTYREVINNAPDNSQAHYNLGRLLLEENKAGDAESHLSEAVRLKADDPQALTALGRALALQGKLDQAEPKFRAALALAPTNSDAHITLANLFVAMGKTNEASTAFHKAVQLDPDLPKKQKLMAAELQEKGNLEAAVGCLTVATFLDPSDADAHEQLGLLLARNGRIDQALDQFRELMRIRPDAQTCHHLGLALLMKGDVKQAVENYRRGLKLRPDWDVLLNDLAWLLATSSVADVRNGPEAVELAERACQLKGETEIRYWGTLDAAYAEAGKFDSAVKTAEKTRQLANSAGNGELAAAAEKRIALYRDNRPYRE